MLEKIIIRDPHSAQWLVFTDPLDVLVARQPADVLDVMLEVERRVNKHGVYAAGFLSYEAARGFDPAYVTHGNTQLPLVCFGLFSSVQRRDDLPGSGNHSDQPVGWTLTTPRGRYCEQLSSIKQQLELGNTYQINYTVRMRADNVIEPWGLFRRMSAGVPQAAYVECRNFAIASASPELFFNLDDERLLCRPMKGTAKRGATIAEDLALRQELHDSIKNRAENLMITDMVRNDLGRVASFGSVKVSNLFGLEEYPTVWQMTSTVAARTRASVVEIFQALFPCASVTGAPKVSSMAIIAELEDTPREIYTGAIGFLGPGRQARFSVAIRTALIDRYTNEAVYGVGGGIVWDSDPDEEFRECQYKARVLTEPATRGSDLR
jgi:para-aminobenzoate synthetase/4-amino-4-deoxychorismate lyase